MQLADHFRELVDSFSDLFAKHLKLARVELKEDAKAIGADVGKIAAFVPLIAVGYLLLMVALALFVARFTGPELGFLAVAVLNLAVGGAGIFLAVRNLQSRQVMNDTQAELHSTALALRGGNALTTVSAEPKDARA